MWFKQKSGTLGDFEQLVLFGVMRLEHGAYGPASRPRSGADAGGSSTPCALRASQPCARRTTCSAPWPTVSKGGWRRSDLASTFPRDPDALVAAAARMAGLRPRGSRRRISVA